jgi:quinol monooxygenase YgiN
MIERIKLEEGCLSCRLYKDVLDEETVMFEEVWTDEKNLIKHLRSEEYRNILLVVEMAGEPPTFQFHQIARSMGIQTIEDALRRGGTTA